MTELEQLNIEIENTCINFSAIVVHPIFYEKLKEQFIEQCDAFSKSIGVPNIYSSEFAEDGMKYNGVPIYVSSHNMKTDEIKIY